MPKRKATDAEVAEVRGALSVLATVPGWQISAVGANRLENFLQAPAVSFWWDDDDDDGDEEEDTYEVTEEGVAIIPIHGTLLDSPPSWWTRYLGYSSTPQITDWVKAATLDANVKKVFFDTDSPGGMASGLAAAADAIYALRTAGKETASGCRQACSAAYHLVSQTDHIYLTKDGVAGCDGTVIGIGDWSKYYAEMGVERLRITNERGKKFKGAGMMGTAITKDQRDDLGRVCDEYQAIFDTNVARGRGIELGASQELADGRYFIGANAVTAGFVDEILDVQDALAKMGANEELDGDKKDPPTTDPVPTNRSQIAANSGAKGKLSMTWEEFKSLFQGSETDSGGQAAAPVAPAQTQPAPKPQESAELTELRAFREKAVSSAREKAIATAVTAFGQGDPRLARATNAINAMTDPEAIGDYAALMETSTPGTIQKVSTNGATASRYTAPQAVASGGESESGDDDKDLATQAKSIVSRSRPTASRFSNVGGRN